MARLFLVAILVLGSIARLVWIDRVPGIDGDEAWYGVNVQVFRDGGVPFRATGVGNPLNPFHSLPLLALASVMAPLGTLLRAPEVIWGILATVVAYPLFSRVIGRRAAVLTAALVALSPAAIAYSRFGWDPSGTPLAALLAVGFACRQQAIAAALACVAAIVIHPTNVFIVPIVLSGFAPVAQRRYATLSPQGKRRLWFAFGCLFAIGLPLALWVLDTIAERPNTSIPSLEIVGERALTPGAWRDTAVGALRIFSGVTTVSDMAGPPPSWVQPALDIVALVVLVLPQVAAVRRRLTDRGTLARWLGVGLLASLTAFHIVAGPMALVSGRERYGLVFLVPEIVLCALAIDALREWRPALARAAVALTLGSFTGLIVFGYFVPLVSRGGDARDGLRTGRVEPKVAAFEYLVAQAGPADVVQVITDDWYLYWPMRYLAGADKRFRVELTEGANAPGGVRPRGVRPEPYPHAPDRVYAVVFDSGGEWPRLTGMGRKAAFTAFDPVDRPILHVVPVAEGEYKIQ